MGLMRRQSIGAFALVAMLALAACTGGATGSSSGPPQKGGRITIGIAQAWGPLDSLELNGGTSGRIVANNIYDTLVSVDEDGHLIPKLATSWDVSKNGLRYVFNLRKDVLFQDGTEFNARAVKLYWDRMMDPKNNCRCLDLIKPVDTVKVTGKYQVTFLLSEPVASFVAMQVDTVGMIPSPTAVEKLGEDFTRKPVGAGPFKFVSQISDDKIVLEQFEDYWQADRPYLDQVTFRNVPDNDTLLTATQTGDIDIALQLPMPQVHAAKQQAQLNAVKLGQLGVERVSLNWNRPPFDDIRARKAINYATDVKTITKAVDFGLVSPITHPFSAFYPDLGDVEYPTYNPEKARKLVDDLGGSINFQLTTSSIKGAWAQAAQAMWKKVGINAKIQMMDPNAQIAGLAKGNFQAGTSGYSGAWDPDLVSYDMFFTGSNRNYPNMSDPKVDKLLLAGRKTTDPAKRERIYSDLAVRLGEVLPYIWMNGMTKYAVTTTRVHNLSLIGDGLLRLNSTWVSE